jgi:hypothetical protein
MSYMTIRIDPSKMQDVSVIFETTAEAALDSLALIIFSQYTLAFCAIGDKLKYTGR